MADTSDLTAECEDFRARWNKAVRAGNPVRFWVDDGYEIQHSSTYIIGKDVVIEADIPEMLDFLGELALDPNMSILRWGYTILPSGRKEEDCGD